MKIMREHELVIQDFLAKNPGWRKNGLRKEINAVMGYDVVGPLGFIPDAFQIDVDAQYVRLLEVDGESHTLPEKLARMCDLWFCLDSLSWSMELITINLFTGSKAITSDLQFTKLWHDGIENYVHSLARLRDAQPLRPHHTGSL